jgi:protein ImuA
VVASGGQVVLVGPPKTPHLPGLWHSGIDDKHLVWIQADVPAERLWCTEQLVKAGSGGALLAWLPQARPDQIRRLQVCARGAGGPVFLFRPESAQHEASAAPLRVLVSVGADWELHVRLLKRRGASHEGLLRLSSIPGGLEAVITPRLQHPSRLLAARQRTAKPTPEVSAHAVGSASASPWPGRRAALR